jgi:hypothetical protein
MRGRTIWFLIIAAASHGFVASTGEARVIGFGSSGAGWTVNNALGSDTATIANDVLTITNNGFNDHHSAFFNTPQTITGFSITFTYQATGGGGSFCSATGKADGFALVLSNDSRGPSAVGTDDGGSGLGYATIIPSSAVEFNLHTDPGTGYFTNGCTGHLCGPAYMSTSPISIPSGDHIAVRLTYDGTTLTEDLRDEETAATFSTSYDVNVPQDSGGTTAFVGLTGGTGLCTSIQTITNFDFEGCGDGVIDPLEQCDDGPLNGTPESCCDATCHFKPANTACDDGNACTQTDQCNGADNCIGSNPVVCTARDQCHEVGTCNPSTGVCSDPAKADGSSCNDGNLCTQTDTCERGVCTGSNPLICTSPDQCHDGGTCNPATGICSGPPKPDGTSCNDGNACTQTDTCQGGSCVGSNPIVCQAQDVCHDAGVCDSGTGVCSNPAFDPIAAILADPTNLSTDERALQCLLLSWSMVRFRWCRERGDAAHYGRIKTK